MDMTEAPSEIPTRPRRGSWHEKAREMRASGLAYYEIGKRLGVSGPAVYFALNPERRHLTKKREKAEALSRAADQAAKV